MRHEFTRFLVYSRDPWERAKEVAESHSEYCQVFNNGRFRTIFTSEYRFCALNLSDPRVKEGHKIALRAIRKMNESATQRNIRFIVVLIPTKELVFQEVWTNPPPVYRELTGNEGVMWEITKEALKHDGIEYVDALPALREQLAFGIQPYHVSFDGHPNEHGHRAISSLVAARLKQPHQVNEDFSKPQSP